MEPYSWKLGKNGIIINPVKKVSPSPNLLPSLKKKSLLRPSPFKEKYETRKSN